MRLNTITFDANLPTTQQVNVPTNSDYKVGMKVKRNGAVQHIKPSEFTITSEDGTTIPVDPEKTNGYVTITKASGDNASFKQYGVHIDKGYDFNDTITCHGFSTSTTQISAMINSSDYDTDALGIVGIEVFAKDLYKGGITNLSADSDDPANITRWI
jgi:hypothetical protein